MKAVWNGAVLAEADETVMVEGNHYFPPESLSREYFAGSSTRTVCFWKGMASYYTVTVGGADEPGRGLVLPEAVTASPEDQEPCGVLERRPDR